MNKIIKDKFPSWCDDTKNSLSLCLTDDLDSLLSCAFLKKIKGYDITRFYSFNTLYAIGTGKGERLIGVDMDLLNGRCWGNHVISLDKKDTSHKSANLNVINGICRYNYTSKYAGSTLLTILSYYNYSIDNLSSQAQKILLCIDSTYISYYFNKDNCKKYLVDQLEFPQLFNLLETTPKAEFDALHDKYNLKSKIKLDEWSDILTTNIKLGELMWLFGIKIDLPKEELKPIHTYHECKKSLYTGVNYSNSDINKNEIFSLALTNKNFVKYSIQK